MKTKVLVSNQIIEVKSNGSISTRKPSSISMSIDHRFAIAVQNLFLDIKAGDERETGLIRLETYAIYDDGTEESEEEKVEEIVKDIVEDLEEAL